MKIFDYLKARNITTKALVVQAMLAAAYVALTFGLYNLSYGPVQLRIAEFMLILVLINKKHAVGIIIGTFIANLIGAYGVIDMVVGTSASIIVCLLMMLKQPKHLAYLWPTLINAVVIGLMLTYLEETPFLLNAIYVGTGQFFVTTLPFLVFGKKVLENKNFRQILD